MDTPIKFNLLGGLWGGGGKGENFNKKMDLLQHDTNLPPPFPVTIRVIVIYLCRMKNILCLILLSHLHVVGEGESMEINKKTTEYLDGETNKHTDI